ncbi:MAG TPA: methyltransferase type 11 [Planctomycetaceae bacterium]|nr:methyltransferase type 11 [Planctomycetaceae bacterium]HCD00292.1 methyltransferase type 11 [Planctomycetaceae bacterium]
MESDPGTLRASRRELLEISDLVVDFDLETMSRRPVNRAEVVERLNGVGDRGAARIVAAMPVNGGVLDPDVVDRLLIRVHCEMQRLSEEFQHGRRVAEFLHSLLAAFDQIGLSQPYRIVDIGCGTGYVIRWLAARAGFRQDVELIGVDFNEALVREAQRLSAAEQLGCRFEVINAFDMARPATVYLSTGVLHHFRGQGLDEFMLQHDQPDTQAFVHYDFQPTPLARPGAWAFHYIRMREPLSRHDGVISARRAHNAATLLEAARQTSFACGMYGTRVWKLPIPRVFHTLLGIRPEAVDAFRQTLGRRVGRLGQLA